MTVTANNARGAGVAAAAPSATADATVAARTHRPYPQVKIAGLGKCGTHALIDAQIGSTRVGERDGSFSYDLWRTYLLAGAQQGAVERLRGLRPALTRHHREQVVLTVSEGIRVRDCLD